MSCSQSQKPPSPAALARHESAIPIGSAVMRPSPTDTHLLRACLLADRVCETAWVEFAAAVKDPRAFFIAGRSETKSVIPQLFAALQSAGVEIEPGLATYLKTAYVHEEARYQTYSRICARLLAALNAAELPYVLFSGSALAEAFYQPAFLRHCYDIELMVPPGHMQPALAAAAGAGFTVGTVALDQLRGVRCEHRAGVGLSLFPRYTSLVGPDRLLAQAWENCERGEIRGARPARWQPPMPCLPCAAACYGRRASLPSCRRVTPGGCSHAPRGLTGTVS
jgi:hypothetical protein